MLFLMPPLSLRLLKPPVFLRVRAASRAPVIMQTRSKSPVIAFYGRRYITFLGCRAEHLGELLIIEAGTGFN